MKAALIILLCFLVTPSLAQDVIFGKTKALSKFWVHLYVQGGTSLYCDEEFDAEERIAIDYIYPARWMLKQAGCKIEKDCRNLKFQYAMGDLHNQWPVIDVIPQIRNQFAFGEIPGEEDRKFTNHCEDFERSGGANAVVEPRDEVKGDIARSLLYMSNTYDFPLNGMGPMLLRWHTNDPVDGEEKSRNDRIEKIQGSRNPFIDGIDTP